MTSAACLFIYACFFILARIETPAAAPLLERSRLLRLLYIALTAAFPLVPAATRWISQ
jgi:hypothetical protein